MRTLAAFLLGAAIGWLVRGWLGYAPGYARRNAEANKAAEAGTVWTSADGSVTWYVPNDVTRDGVTWTRLAGERRRGSE